MSFYIQHVLHMLLYNPVDCDVEMCFVYVYIRKETARYLLPNVCSCVLLLIVMLPMHCLSCFRHLQLSCLFLCW